MKYSGTLRAESTAYTVTSPNKAAPSRGLEAFDVLAVSARILQHISGG